MIRAILETPGNLASRAHKFFTATQGEIDAESLADDRRLMMAALIVYRLNVEDVISVYVDDSGECTLRTNQRLNGGKYRELPLDILRSCQDWIHKDATIKRTIAALGFASVLMPDGQLQGFNPRKFEIVPADSGENFSSLCNTETGVCVRVRAVMDEMERRFDDARRETPEVEKAQQIAQNYYALSTASTPHKQL
ncbi:MAG: hypothetical protein WBK55_05025 [Alphaproteobacteria bacterium]